MPSTSSQNPEPIPPPAAPKPDRYRGGFIAGLRAFADWLETNLAVQAPDRQQFLLPLHVNEAVEEFAAEHDLTVAYDEEGNASCDVAFGPVLYHVYGYRDFAEHRDLSDERHARQWAARKGFEIRPADSEGGA